MSRPRPGDQWTVPLCTNTTGTLTRDATVTAEQVTRLGCGCWRIETSRPGPADGDLAGRMHLHVARCAFHAVNDPQPEPVKAPTGVGAVS